MSVHTAAEPRPVRDAAGDPAGSGDPAGEGGPASGRGAFARLAAGRSPFWTLQALGWTAYGVSTYLATLPDLREGRYLLVLAFKVVRTAIGFGASLLLRLAVRRAERAGARAPLLAAVAVTASALLGVAWLLLYRQATAPFRPPDLPSIPWPAIPRAALDHAFVLLAWSAAFFGVRMYGRVHREERRALEAANRAREAELRMLRYQLDPHFLFNALNSLRAAIPLAAESARDMVDELSDFLRHTLEPGQGGEVRLGDEFRAVRSYLALEKARFADRIEAEVDLAQGVEPVRVPAFLLHPLVENAVKHGMASGARPLRIVVRAAADGRGGVAVEVANSLGRGAGRGRAGRANGLGVGLENVRRRLELAYGGRATLEFRREDGRALAIVRIAGAAESRA